MCAAASEACPASGNSPAGAKKRMSKRAAIDQERRRRDVLLSRDRLQNRVVEPVLKAADDGRIAAEHLSRKRVDLIDGELHMTIAVTPCSPAMGPLPPGTDTALTAIAASIYRRVPVRRRQAQLGF